VLESLCPQNGCENDAATIFEANVIGILMLNDDKTWDFGGTGSWILVDPLQDMKPSHPNETYLMQHQVTQGSWNLETCYSQWRKNDTSELNWAEGFGWNNWNNDQKLADLMVGMGQHDTSPKLMVTKATLTIDLWTDTQIPRSSCNFSIWLMVNIHVIAG